MFQFSRCCFDMVDQRTQNMIPFLSELTQKGMVFATDNFHGVDRMAKITSRGDRLYLHHLSNGLPTADAAATFEHSHVMEVVDPSNRLVFLRLEAQGSSLGEITVRLKPDTKGAQNFAALCTGIKGPSYAGTNFFEVRHRGNKWEYVGGGDYEYNNGEGGKGLVPGLELGPEYERPWVPGIVRGFWGLGDNVAAQFFIATRSHPSGTCSPAFGVVEEGLDILNQAVRFYMNISEVSVQDCGIVLNG